MGNSTSSGRGHHEETVDFGYLTPQGVYTGPRDWNQSIVAQLICERRLAPFYRPLEDYDESWDDEQILAHRKEPPQDSDSPAEASSSRVDTGSISSSRSHKRGHASTNSKETIRHPEAAIYRGAIECPICFLVRPLYHLCPPSPDGEPCRTTARSVLPTQHQPLALLRSSHMHRVLRPDQACGAESDPSRL